jgi:small multidrug resistance family-3 protein
VTARSIALFLAAAFAEIGGAYLVWVGIKDHKGLVFVALGAMP